MVQSTPPPPKKNTIRVNLDKEDEDGDVGENDEPDVDLHPRDLVPRHQPRTYGDLNIRRKNINKLQNNGFLKTQIRDLQGRPRSMECLSFFFGYQFYNIKSIYHYVNNDYIKTFLHSLSAMFSVLTTEQFDLNFKR